MPPTVAKPSKEFGALRRTCRRGVTLVEVLVTVTVMIALAGLGIPGLLTSFEHAKVRRTAAILSADLQYAQGMAARQRRPVVVVVDSDLRAYTIRDRVSSAVYRTRRVGEDTDFGVATFEAAPSSIVLFPSGAAPTGATFTMGIKDYLRRVTLTQAGQIRLLPIGS